MDQPGSGFTGRGHAADAESPMSEVRLAGGRDAVFDALVDHELALRWVKPRNANSLQQQSIRASTGRRPCVCKLPKHPRRRQFEAQTNFG